MSSRRRRSGDERLYYTPPAMRRNNQLQQQQQQQLKSKSSSSSLAERRGSESDSNLDRFLEHTTPAVPAQHFPRTSVQAWRNRNREFHPYFILGDLWESFREWSVYGAGVPLVLNGTDSVVQYYVPFLSGIQLYVDPSRNVMEQRRPGEESDTYTSSSDGDNECGADRGADNNRGYWHQQSAMGQGYYRLTGKNHGFMGSSVDGGDISNPPGLLIFEYFERELPFHREPLADKISILASRFPVLKTYRSCDLTPASWISIAWYPIYRIPVGPTLQNVDACFLTFHSLAKPVTSGEGGLDAGSKLSLPTFGLVSYKFKVSDWDGNGVQEGQKINSLLRAADNWLRLLQVNHPDYSFFTSRSSYWR
ncbi:uncharacterized protein LOC105156861 isoform X2 [Sesamum indicum]|uniref:Uncharacterized protein LOC105156861 isoform X2 n=1 Tax=Sesamum indicum TaxID=4182 RepID=A0A6I9SQC5_SESIN|nr:uncharacterized protein LOC105156861 isoform X2 [Sesamum indicum]